MEGQADLTQAIRTLHPPGSFSSSLDRGQQQPDHHTDDGNDNQQFNQGEPAARGVCVRSYEQNFTEKERTGEESELAEDSRGNPSRSKSPLNPRSGQQKLPGVDVELGQTETTCLRVSPQQFGGPRGFLT